MTNIRSRDGAASAALVALLALLLVVSQASAKTFEITYDWNDARFGAQGWRVDNAPPTDALGTPWYATTHTVGAGLKIVPTGGTRPYRDARGTWAWDPPAGASLRRARIEGLDGKAVQRQFARAWLVVGGEPPEARSNLRELGYDGTGQPSAEWTNRSYSLITPAGKDGVGFVLWLFTIPCESLDEPSACVPVAPSDGASVSLRKAVFTVDDPSKPTVTVDGLPEGTTWTRNRQVRVKVASADPQSGIAKVEAVVRDGAEARTINLGQWNPDRFHVATRAPGTPPLEVARSADRTVTVARSGTTRLSFRATNGAGATTTSQAQVRVDRDRPDIDWPRRPGPGDALRVADSPSGVASATLTVDGRERDTCANARSCRLVVPSDVSDRARVAVRVVDRAGNERSGDRTVRVAGVAKDRRSPRIEWPRKVKPGSVVTVSDVGSGIAEATLVVRPGEELERCGGGRRRCSWRVPTAAAGEQISATASDRAGNETSSTRMVRRRSCRSRSACPPPTKPSDTSFLSYPADGADLWAGPLRFRWQRPNLKGINATAPLWYRVELDGEEVYAGREMEHEVYGLDVDDHMWRVVVYRTSTSRRPLKAMSRSFRMVEYGGATGAPTDTDTTPEEQVATSRAVASTAAGVAFAGAGKTADSASARDLGRRFAPSLFFDGGERWRPLSVDEFLSENNLHLCSKASGERKCAFRGRIPSPDLAGDAVGDRYLDIGDPGNQDDKEYKVHRACGIAGPENQEYECRGDQQLYYTIRYTSKRGGLYAIGYWWFWRYNDGNSKDCSGIKDAGCKALGAAYEKAAGGKRTGDHEGDWEGVTVYVDRDGKRIRDIAFRQHGQPVHYGSDSWDFTGGSTKKRGTHIKVFPSKGRHASYPRAGKGLDTKGEYDNFRELGEVYDGKRQWDGNGRQSGSCFTVRKEDGKQPCVVPFPVQERKSLNQALVPTGSWASYRNAWGGSVGKQEDSSGQETSPRGPGVVGGSNEDDFRQPFNLERLVRPTGSRSVRRAEARAVRDDEPIVSDAPCESWFGDGVGILACGSGAGEGSAISLIRPNRAAGALTIDRPPLGPGWIAQQAQQSTPRPGDVLRISDSAGTLQTVLSRVTGAEGQPYVARIAPPVGTGPIQDLTIRVIETASGMRLTGAPPSWGLLTRPGVSGASGMWAHVHADRKSNRGALWVGGARLRKAQLSAVAEEGGTVRPVRIAGPVKARTDGYERWPISLPQSTKYVYGTLTFVGGRRRRVVIDVNASIFERSSKGPGGGRANNDGSGRPTK